MKRVPYAMYAEQDENNTRIMLAVEGDKPLILWEYDRKLVDSYEKVAIVHIEGHPFGEGGGHSFTAFHITVNPTVKEETGV